MSEKAREMIRLVAEAEDSVRARWSLAALRRVQPDYADQMGRQSERWATACVTGADRDVLAEGRSMIKGWQAIELAFQGHSTDHDAYLVGQDASTGLTVVVGDRKGSEAAFKATDGADPRVIHLTPDEVATLAAAAGMVVAVKQEFDGAEVVG